MRIIDRFSYRGPVRLVIFDLAGTMVDHGCIAPVAAFVEGFKTRGVTVSPAQVREHMGQEKRAHLQAIGKLPAVAQQWQAAHGRALSESDIDALYDAFMPLLLNILPDYASLVPGGKDAVNFLAERGVPYAATTGYPRPAADVVLDAAAQEGFRPQFSCCATEVPAGRPEPWMIFQAMQAQRIFPAAAVVNIGDTKVDVESGVNAGAWSVGVAASGNQIGLSPQELAKLEEEERRILLSRARNELRSAGAHYVLDTVAELPEVIQDIELRLGRGENPLGN